MEKTTAGSTQRRSGRSAPRTAVPAPQPSARRLKPFVPPLPVRCREQSGWFWGWSGGQRPLSSRRHFPSAPQRGVSHPDCAFTGRAATAQPDHRGAEPCPLPGELTARGAEAKPAAERDRCSQLGGGNDPRSGPGPAGGSRGGGNPAQHRSAARPGMEELKISRFCP